MINLFSEKEIGILKKGGKVLATILNQLATETKTGVTGSYLNTKAEDLIRQKGARPSFLGYRGFPASLCVSINDEVVHGVPDEREFKNGDLVGLDLGLIYQNLYLDKATTVIVDEEDENKRKFLSTIEEALDLGIQKAKAGHNLGEVSAIIEKTILDEGYGLVRNLYGHGVGRKVHEEPKIPNFGKKTDGPVLKEGMVLAIEPMATMGKGDIKVKDNGTVATLDSSLSGHFENTMAITKKGPVILTRI